jgi:small conductance mechanosensitive channel
VPARGVGRPGRVGARSPNRGTGGNPAAAGAASLLGAAGVDAAAVQLPPETLNPEIDLDELEIRLVPMTRSELAALAARWQGIVKQKSEEIVAAQIAVARSDGSALLSRSANAWPGWRTNDGSWWIGFCVVLNGLEAKGAAEEVISEYRAYVDALIDKTIEVSDLRRSCRRSARGSRPRTAVSRWRERP